MESWDDIAQIVVFQVALPVCDNFLKTSDLPDICSRYAAEGDANGEPISRNEEGEKLQRLEKEVLNYPGCVFSIDIKYTLTFSTFSSIASNQRLS